MQKFIDKYIGEIMACISILFFLGIGIGIYSHFHHNTLGVSNVPAQFETSLAIPEATTDTQITLASDTLQNGNTLSGPYCFTVDSNTSLNEYECGTASSTDPFLITNITRGVDPQYGTSSVASLIYSHRAGADVRITDFPNSQIYAHYFNDVSGIPNPISYSGVSTSTLSQNNNYLATVGYANGIAVQGAPLASLTQQGLVQAATALQTAAGQATGTTGALLFAENSSFSSSSSATILIPVTQANGKLNANFIDQTANYSWSGTQTFSNTFTANATATAPFLAPVGAMEMYASSTAPNGWLLANGQNVSTTTYANLFSIIGYTYGSSTNGTLFSLPNMGGRTAFGPSTSTPFSTTLGTIGGATTSSVSVSGILNSGPGAFNGLGSVYGNSSATFNSTGSAGILPPYIILNYIIKY